jgi:hypothetical protein
MRGKDGVGEFDMWMFAAEACSYDLFDLQDSGLVAA